MTLVQLDVTDLGSVSLARQEILRSAGSLDILVNNVGTFVGAARWSVGSASRAC